MFDAIKNIAVDRKNSLPVADFKTRYKSTGTPVVFGDLTQRWLATRLWSLPYLKDKVGQVTVPIYSNKPDVNRGRPNDAVLNSNLASYFDDLIHRDNDLRVTNVPFKSLLPLQKDIITPRLGLEFNERSTSFSVAGKGAVEPMQQLSTVKHKVLCHFGDKASVLLVPANQSDYIYKVGRIRRSIRDIDFDKPQFDKYPGLNMLSAYVAELGHGDALYVPAGFWYCIAYEGVGTIVSYEFLSGNVSQFFGAASHYWLNRLIGVNSNSEPSLSRQEKRTLKKTNKLIR